MTNKLFPHWKTANIVLEDLVDAHFGVYVDINRECTSEVDLLFLPRFVHGSIPPEDRENFTILYDNFAHDMDIVLNIGGIFSHYKHRPNTDAYRESLKADVERTVHAYEANTGLELKNVLKGYLGIPQYRIFKSMLFQKTKFLYSIPNNKV